MTSMRRRFTDFAERHWKMAWVVLVAIPLTYLGWCITDREPPFEELHYHEPTPIKAGEELALELDVDRDTDRSCSAEISRFFTDSMGYRTDYSPPQFLGAAGIKAREATTAGKLKLRIKIPDTMPAGRSTLNTETKYRCDRNILTAWFPIIVSSSWAFTVLPPTPSKTIIIKE